MSVVWLVQDVPNRDFSQAAKLGDEVKVVALRDFPFWDVDVQEDHLATMRRKFATFNAENDFIVLVGDPINIGIVFNMALRKGGGRFLKFDKHINGYNLVTLKGEGNNGQKDSTKS